MQNVYIIPGFLTTELFTDPSLTKKLWISYYELSLGRAGMMRLAPNGISPGPPDGVPCFANAPDPTYWAAPMALLRAQLGHDFVLRPWGFDWRKDLYHHGQILASTIKVSNTPANPCTIVAHSTGGLVARAAWAELGNTGDQNLVRRIVTLGTPHQGTYIAPLVLTGESEYLNDLARINAWGQFVTIMDPLLTPPYEQLSRLDLATIAATWPSLYQLFPVYGSADSVYDPYRSDLFTASNWDGLPVPSQTWLDVAKGSWASFLNSAASVPPPWVLTTVSGTGHGGTYKTITPSRIGHPDAFFDQGDGDGIVGVKSAEIPGSAVFTLSCRHTDLPLVTSSSGMLADWIRDDRSAPAPAPPKNYTGLVAPELIGDPPIPYADSVLILPNLCSQGKCSC